MWCLLTGLSALGSACSAEEPWSQRQAQPEQYRPATATIKDIMDSMIDPSANALWDSMAVHIGAEGTGVKIPRNDEEWRELQCKAITLAEAANLLLMPGRRVAKSGEKSENPKIELQPEQIEILIGEDRAAWSALARGLHDSTMPVLDAIEKKDVQALLAGGNAINRACDKCHQKYWYPNRQKVLQEEAQRYQRQDRKQSSPRVSKRK